MLGESAIDTHDGACHDHRMLRLLEGHVSERVPLLTTPQMKSAASDAATDAGQNLSEWIRHTVARRLAEIERGRLSEELEKRDREGKDRLLALARDQRGDPG